MTEEDIIQAISINLLRMGEWYYKDPEGNAVVCERYLEQSKSLAKQVHASAAKRYIDQLEELSLSSNDPSQHLAERFLTLGVLMQHPQKWM